MISIKNLSFNYDNKQIFHDLNFHIKKGTLTAIFGPNGIGKTTFLKLIAKMHHATTGCVDCKSNNIGFLVQRNWLDLNFPISVYDVASMGFLKEKKWLQSKPKNSHNIIRAALKKVGLEQHEQSYVGELSGGQFQRLLFARIIIQDPEIILLDEPFNAIDCQTLIYLIEQIQEWHQQQKTILVVLHDFDLIKQYFEECIFITDQFIKKFMVKDINHEQMNQMLFCGKHYDFL